MNTNHNIVVSFFLGYGLAFVFSAYVLPFLFPRPECQVNCFGDAVGGIITFSLEWLILGGVFGGVIFWLLEKGDKMDQKSSVPAEGEVVDEEKK